MAARERTRANKPAAERRAQLRRRQARTTGDLLKMQAALVHRGSQMSQPFKRLVKVAFPDAPVYAECNYEFEDLPLLGSETITSEDVLAVDKQSCSPTVDDDKLAPRELPLSKDVDFQVAEAIRSVRLAEDDEYFDNLILNYQCTYFQEAMSSVLQGITPPAVSDDNAAVPQETVHDGSPLPRGSPLVQFFGHDPVAVDEVPFGQLVRLGNLQSRDLNGAHALLDRYLPDSGRFAVSILEGPAAGQQKMIKPCNLTDPSEDWLTDSDCSN